jgi:predicted dehydrogenase
MLALRAGKHAFTQKPMTHSISEARLLGTTTRENKLMTQMGNQGTAEGNLRKSAAIAKSGALGKITECHVWTNRPVWPQSGDRPAEGTAPEFLDGNAWLGPAPERPYGPGYHPFSWRGWWNFRTGALGDMACHTFNMPFMALGLRDPISVEAETSGHNKDSYPKWSVITFQFPANDTRGPVKVVWYDGGKRPSPELFDGKRVSETGSLIISDKGKLHSLGDYGGDLQDDRRRRADGLIREEPRPLHRIRRSDQGRTGTGVELPRLRRPADRNDPARQPGPCSLPPTASRRRSNGMRRT